MAILENVLGFLRVVDALDPLLQRNLPELLGCLTAMMGAHAIESLLGLGCLVDLLARTTQEIGTKVLLGHSDLEPATSQQWPRPATNSAVPAGMLSCYLCLNQTTACSWSTCQSSLCVCDCGQTRLPV